MCIHFVECVIILCLFSEMRKLLNAYMRQEHVLLRVCVYVALLPKLL